MSARVSVRVSVSPELLLWAVERSGKSLLDLTESIPGLGNWISKKTSPTLKQLQSFADKTHTPVGMLFLDTPPAEVLPIPDMRTVKNRDLTHLTADLLDTIYDSQAKQDWYRDYALENGAEPLDFVASCSTGTPVQEAAKNAITLLKLPLTHQEARKYDEAFRVLCQRVEETGILVIVNGIVQHNTHRILDVDEFRGFALTDAITPLIFINGQDTRAGKIFTLLHEFGHILLGQSALDNPTLTDTGKSDKNDTELWCNEFAAHTLIPDSLITNITTRELNQQLVDNLARQTYTSTLTVLNRLYGAGLLSWDKYTTWYKKEEEQALEYLHNSTPGSAGGNFYNMLPLRASKTLTRAIITSTLEGQTLYTEALSILGIKNPEAIDHLAKHLEVA